MAETWTIAEIVLCSIAVLGCIAVAVLFFTGLNIPPECCAPSQQSCEPFIEIESELIQ